MRDIILQVFFYEDHQNDKCMTVLYNAYDKKLKDGFTVTPRSFRSGVAKMCGKLIDYMLTQNKSSIVLDYAIEDKKNDIVQHSLIREDMTINQIINVTIASFYEIEGSDIFFGETNDIPESVPSGEGWDRAVQPPR